MFQIPNHAPPHRKLALCSEQSLSLLELTTWGSCGPPDPAGHSHDPSGPAPPDPLLHAPRLEGIFRPSFLCSDCSFNQRRPVHPFATSGHGRPPVVGAKSVVEHSLHFSGQRHRSFGLLGLYQAHISFFLLRQMVIYRLSLSVNDKLFENMKLSTLCLHNHQASHTPVRKGLLKELILLRVSFKICACRKEPSTLFHHDRICFHSPGGKF